ncbi:MAG: carboxypeptidase regulatory-like domain-containing protein [Candidatus Acidiferrum sp.]
MKGTICGFQPSEILKSLAKAGRLFVCAMLAMLCASFVAMAQDTGYISGTVTDSSGAAVAGAQVVIASTTGSSTHTTTTNGDGAYVVPGLPGGSYNIVVTAKGFQKFTAQKVVLDVATKIRVDVQLTVGQITQEVVVTGESVAQVETQSSALSATITGSQVEKLELNGRNFTQLVTLSPGVVNQTGTDEGKVGVYGNVSYAINGGRVEYNNWELDGGDNMDNGSNSTLNVYPNVEAIAEFKVLTSNYGAQYGRNGSGTVEVETKSGGSSFHGSAFEYLRNDFFNARPWSSGNIPGDPNPPYKKHDFGYTVGGPVYIPNHYNTDKKKTFFFWSQEWRREKEPSAIDQNVPSVAERGGDFSALCATDPADCPNTGPNPVANVAAVPISAAGQALESLIPMPNTTLGGFPAYAQTVSTPTTWREQLIRIDHNLSDKYRLTFRYIHDSWSTVVPNPLWGVGSSDFQNIQTNFVGPGTSFVARLNANFSPTLLNEFVASYTADHIFLTALNEPTALPAGAMGALFNNGFGGKLPSINLGGNAAYDGGNSGNGALAQDTGYFPWNNANPTYTYRDNLTKIAGNHTLIIGVYFAAAQKNEDNSPDIQGILSFSTSSPISTGNSFADMLLGNVAQYQQTNLEAKYYNRYKIVEPYFQDDWRVTKRLTLNLGLRVSLYGTYRERYQHAFAFDPADFNASNEPVIDATGNLTGNAGALEPGLGNPFNGLVQCGGTGGTSSVPANILTVFSGASVAGASNAGCMSGHLFNPAPRIGFAFDPKGDGKMAIRGGYGIFYEHTNGNEGNTESLEGSAPYVLTSSQFNVTGYNNIGGGGGVFFPLTLTEIPTQVQWPYVQQWNLDVQRELPEHIILSVAYVGSKGTHLTILSDANQLFPVPAGSNPYAAGQPITAADCNNIVNPANGLPMPGATLGNGTPVPSAALNNLFVACGNSADLVRTNFPGVSTVQNLQDGANSIYHALQVSANRTIGDLTVSVAYTYSHSIDDSSDRSDSAFVNSYDYALNRASSTFDQRQNLAISYNYNLPFFKGTSGFAHTLLYGWQISGITVAQTGTPFSVNNNTTYGDNAGVGNGEGTGSRPDLVGNPYAVTAAQRQAADAASFGVLYYNPNAFAIPTGLTFGNVGRDTLYLPGRLNFDFGLIKDFAIKEKAGFTFKWEMFNMFNHTQFNGIDSGLHDGGAFLQLNSTHDPRIMQFGLRFYF